MASPSQSFTFNAYQSNLAGPLIAGLTTVVLDFIPSGLGVPAYLVIDPDVPASREYVKVLAYTNNTIDNMERGLEGSAGDVDHLVGAVIRAVYTMQMLDDTFLDIDTNAQNLQAHADDVGDPHAAAGYVKEVEGDTRWVELTGDTMTGLLAANGGISITGAGIPDQTATARHVLWDNVTGRIEKSADQYLGPYLRLLGGTLTGGLTITAGAGIRVVDGGLGAPPFSFSSSPTSGMYLSAGSGLRFSYDGVFILELANEQTKTTFGQASAPSYSFQAASSSGMYFTSGQGVRIGHQGTFVAEFGDQQVRAQFGSVTTPAFTFQAAPSSGMYYLSANGVRIGHAGVFVCEFGSAQVRAAPGTEAAPSHTFQSDPDTGMYQYGSNALGFSAGGTVILRVAATSMFVEPDAVDVRFRAVDAFPTTGNLGNAYMQPGTGRFFVSTSARKYKTNIKDAALLADLVLSPVTFHRDDDDADFVGFIADDMPDDRLIEYGSDGEPQNYDVRGVVAILAAKVNRLEAALELV